MSSISSVSSSKSIYGNRNVITGLASGMDTEGMIENAISGYQSKISKLQQDRTKTEWKQEAYRSIIDKMAAFTEKYTSYRSSTNLMSTSFFNQAVNSVSKGENASKVSASGRGGSDVVINAVKQLATAARYTVSGGRLGGKGTSDSGYASAVASKGIDLDADVDVSTIAGTMTVAYGGENSQTSLEIEFGELDVFQNASELAAHINKQLESQSIATSSGTTKKATEMIQARVKDGSIEFVDVSSSGNGFYISSASKSIQDTLGIKPGSGVKGFEVKDPDALKKTVNTAEYLSKTTLNITLDGVTKTVKMPGTEELEALVGQEIPGKTDYDNQPVLYDKNSAYIKILQDNVDSAFGTFVDGEGKAQSKLKVSDVNANTGEPIKLQFESGQKASTFQIKSSKGEAMGFGDDGLNSYISTSQTLKDILGEDGLKKLDFEEQEKKDASGKTVLDEDGKPVMEKVYSFKVNGEEIGKYTEDTALATIMNNLNSNAKAGVSVSYSKNTNEFTFTAKNTGAAERIDLGGETSLAGALFGGGKEIRGQDAIFSVSVNGGEEMELTRASNIAEFDGLTVTLKGTFGYGEDQAVTDRNGNQIFTYGDGKQFYGKQTDAGMELVDQNGKAYKYTSGTNDNIKGQTIYGEVGKDGKLNLYVTGKDGTKQSIYAQKSAGSDGTWFSIKDTFNGNPAYDISAVTASSRDPDAEGVTFETSADADKIVDAVKSMVEDYNAMVTEIKNAYSTLPLQRTSGAYYEPLTDEDMEDMSESAIKAWEDKAKTGLLFGDTDLSSLYRRLTSAVSMSGSNGDALKAAGITLSYSSGLTTLSFDEKTLRDTLNSDPDKVRDIFTDSTEGGAKSNGLMQSLKAPLDLYGATTGTSAITGSKGVLVNKAGSPLAASTMYNNTIQKQLNKIDEQIEKWQEKMSDQVDYYTNQFSRLEQLISQMNSQSSSIMSMMGGY